MSSAAVKSSISFAQSSQRHFVLTISFSVALQSIGDLRLYGGCAIKATMIWRREAIVSYGISTSQLMSMMTDCARG